MVGKPQKSKVWLSPPREKGGVTAKNLYGCGGRCEGRGERDEGWDEISSCNFFPILGHQNLDPDPGTGSGFRIRN